MAEKRSIGLASLKIGNIASDGGMGTTLESLGSTYKDSCELIQEDPQVTDIESEESDDPVESIETLGARTLKWSIMDFSPQTIVKVLGGTVTGSGTELAPYVWNAPSISPAIEKSIELVSKSGVKFQIPRAKIMAKLNAKIVKNGVALIDITAKILTPTKSGVSPIMISEA